MAWLPLLWLLDPASAYMQRVDVKERGGRTRRRLVHPRGPGWVQFGYQRAPPEARSRHLPDRVPAERGPSNWAHRRAELEASVRGDVERGAAELLQAGATRLITRAGSLEARLVRFWNGSAILECRHLRTDGSNGRTFTRVDRRELKDNSSSRLALHLWADVRDIDRAVSPELWGPPPTPPARVRSPGGWEPPKGVRPGWNWMPPGGGILRPDLMPMWLRAWSRVPFVDRYAHPWMWSRGGFEVAQPSAAGD